MNNYLTTESVPDGCLSEYYTSPSGSEATEDAIKLEIEKKRREQLQERHYNLLTELQQMSSELPMYSIIWWYWLLLITLINLSNRKYQQRLPYELLSNLASCLLDDTIPKIVSGLKDIQLFNEKNMFEKRQRFIENLKGYKQTHKKVVFSHENLFSMIKCSLLKVWKMNCKGNIVRLQIQWNLKISVQKKRWFKLEQSFNYY